MLAPTRRFCVTLKRNPQKLSFLDELEKYNRIHVDGVRLDNPYIQISSLNNLLVFTTQGPYPATTLQEHVITVPSGSYLPKDLVATLNKLVDETDVIFPEVAQTVTYFTGTSRFSISFDINDKNVVTVSNSSFNYRVVIPSATNQIAFSAVASNSTCSSIWPTLGWTCLNDVILSGRVEFLALEATAATGLYHTNLFQADHAGMTTQSVSQESRHTLRTHTHAIDTVNNLVTLTGTVTTNSTRQVYGTNTLFLEELRAGEYIELGASTDRYFVERVASNTTLFVSNPVINNTTNGAIRQVLVNELLVTSGAGQSVKLGDENTTFGGNVHGVNTTFLSDVRVGDTLSFGLGVIANNHFEVLRVVNNTVLEVSALTDTIRAVLQAGAAVCTKQVKEPAVSLTLSRSCNMPYINRGASVTTANTVSALYDGQASRMLEAGTQRLLPVSTPSVFLCVNTSTNTLLVNKDEEGNIQDQRTDVLAEIHLDNIPGAVCSNFQSGMIAVQGVNRLKNTELSIRDASGELIPLLSPCSVTLVASFFNKHFVPRHSVDTIGQERAGMQISKSFFL